MSVGRLGKEGTGEQGDRNGLHGMDSFVGEEGGGNLQKKSQLVKKRMRNIYQ
jgi:hypothetical protein